MNRIVEVVPDGTALWVRALDIVLTQFHAAIAERGRFTLALSGGSTPKALYRAIATQDLPWEKLYLFWGDERYVPPDHPDSNQGMTRHVWLDQIAIPSRNVFPMPTLAVNPEGDASAYEATLQAFFAVAPGELPTLDLVLLGMGEDGHTASLFPHTQALEVRDRLITVGYKDGQPRLTFTVPLINQARCVLFMAAGAGKQQALRHVFAPIDSETDYPSRLIQPRGELRWLLDQAAAQGLEGA
ncbi:6-phosphogluconolactonase [Neosynechococcus sphagnicola sy1]|uniref:6-phosphogluconolactonase n=1 Tax=Neosynechococcus sphagnicola sy1 TaxID=1497020 RepID=A0A098TML5_9CYAN|nr:6-phosphogluconolactonase [Neosynechococcus sphagnicola]KGF73092.1 6-phosphogluconolactonase [Neosynechococcus sphagnicola sy1]